MKYPCKKCISYAICVAQKYINCELLYEYAIAYANTEREFWRLIRKTAPRCEEMSKDGTMSICCRRGIGRSGGVIG